MFIGGWGRSGSTLLDRMLGQVPGLCATGEMRQIWERGYLENRRCGCGVAFRECPFWGEVGGVAFGGWESLDVRRTLRLRKRLDRLGAIPALAVGGGGHAAEVQEYAGTLGRLYRGVHEVSGATVVVDSSKSPAHALLLRRVPGVDLRMVHLVRDARGVTFSWQRDVEKRLEGERTGKERAESNPLSSSWRWLAYNGLAPSLRRAGIPYMLVRYEDLVSDPAGTLGRIVAHVDVVVPGGGLSFVKDGVVTLRPDHIAFGNRMRFTVGEVPLRVDEEWRDRMGGGSRRVVTSITLPLLMRFGYVPRRRPAPGRPAPAQHTPPM